MFVFPAPMVLVDFQWIQENWERYVEGKDPMAVYRSEGT